MFEICEMFWANTPEFKREIERACIECGCGLGTGSGGDFKKSVWLLRLLVFPRNPRCSHYTFANFSLQPRSVFLFQAAAASWASGHTRPQPPSHIESPPLPESPSKSFLYCYVNLQAALGYTSSDTSVKGTRHAQQRRPRSLFTDWLHRPPSWSLHPLRAGVKPAT